MPFLRCSRRSNLVGALSLIALLLDALALYQSRVLSPVQRLTISQASRNIRYRPSSSIATYPLQRHHYTLRRPRFLLQNSENNDDQPQDFDSGQWQDPQSHGKARLDYVLAESYFIGDVLTSMLMNVTSNANDETPRGALSIGTLAEFLGHSYMARMSQRGRLKQCVQLEKYLWTSKRWRLGAEQRSVVVDTLLTFLSRCEDLPEKEWEGLLSHLLAWARIALADLQSRKDDRERRST